MSNVLLNAGSGGATLGTDQVAGTPNVDYQIVKIGYSVAGSTPTQVSASNPLPVANFFSGTAASVNTGNADAGTLRVVLATNQPALSNAQPVAQSGSWTVNLGTLTGVALDATVAALQVAQGSTTAGQKGALALGAVTTAAPSYTTAQSSPLSLTAAGGLRVDGSAVTQPVNQTQWAGTSVDVNSGNKSAGTLRVVLATDQPSLSNALPVSQSGAWAVTTTPASTAPVDHADVTVLATTTDSTITANASRKSVTICNLSANGGPIRVRLHASGVGGVEVLPGSFYNIQTTSALDVVNPNAGSIVYAWQEYQ